MTVMRARGVRQRLCHISNLDACFPGKADGVGGLEVFKAR
jgi:hypothetical protein